MGFLKNILGSILNEGKTALVNEVKKAVSDNAAKSTSAAQVNAPDLAAVTQAVPDKPVAFAFKNSWICVKSNSIEEVISKLRLIDAVPANWSSGMDGVDSGKLFVSPVINGWVAVVGYPTYDGSEPTSDNDRLAQLSQNFDELQAFCTHRTVDLQMWAKFRQGRLVRSYGWLGESGEVLMNNGELTPEEQELDFGRFITDTNDDTDWDSADFPDEMSVCEIAAAWGIDPLFLGENYEVGTGFIVGMR